MIQRGGRQHDEAAVDRREGRGRARLGAAPWSSAAGCRRRTAARRSPTGAAPPPRARRCARVGGVVAAIVESVVLDQGEGRFEHRRAEVERVVGDRFGLAPDIAPPLQRAMSSAR
jgi:hypothetical protein